MLVQCSYGRSYFDFDLKNNILRFFELITNLINDREKKLGKVVIKLFATFMAIGCQWSPSWLHFSNRPND
jgi:hypothetical protein